MKLATLTIAALLTTGLGWALAPMMANAADPPPQAEQQAQPQAVDEVAFLGIDTVPMRPEARRGLNLKPGTALVIHNVGPGTPAAEAGLLPGDVLVKLNDQLIINGQQLGVLVRTFTPGDQIALHILRDGERIELDATLTGRAAAPEPMVKRRPMQPMPDFGDLDALLDQFRGPDVDHVVPGGNVRDIFDQMQRRMTEQRDEMQRMMDQMRDRLGGQGMRSSVSINDGKHSIQLKTNGQEKHLTIKTRDGDVLFEGPLPEGHQIEGLPADVQKKVNDLMNNNHIELHRIKPRQQEREPLPVA